MSLCLGHWGRPRPTLEHCVVLYCILAHAWKIHQIRSEESRCVFCGTPQVVFHDNLLAFITASKSSRRTPGSVRAPSFIQLSLDFAKAKPNNFVDFDIHKLKSSEKPDTRDGILYAPLGEFWETATEIQERWRRVSIRKIFVTFAQNKCSEAKILNDQQPGQGQDKLSILDSVSNWSEKKTEELKPDTVTLKTSITSLAIYIHSNRARSSIIMY